MTKQDFGRAAVVVVVADVNTGGEHSLAHLVSFPCGMSVPRSMEHRADTVPDRAVRAGHCDRALIRQGSCCCGVGAVGGTGTGLHLPRSGHVPL